MSHSKSSAYQVYASSDKKSSKKEKSRDKKYSKEKPVSSDSDNDVLKASYITKNIKYEDEYDETHRRSSSSKHKKHKSKSHKKKVDTSSSDEDSNEDRSRGGWKKSRHYSDSGGDDGDLRHDSAEENSREKRSWKESSSKNLVRPVVVDMSVKGNGRHEDNRSSNTERKLKSLFETYIPPPKRAPSSLMDLPNDSLPIGRHSHNSNNRHSYNSRESYNERRRNNGARENYKRRNSNSGDEREYSSKRFQRERDERRKPEPVQRLLASSSSKNSFVIIPATSATTGLHGRAIVKVLKGTVKILGHQLELGKSYPVFSPVTGGLLSLHASGEMLSKKEVKQELSKQGFADLDESLQELGDSTIVILLVNRLDSVLCDYITTFLPYSQLFATASQRDENRKSIRGVTLNKVGLKVAPPEEFVPTCIGMSKEHQEILDKWSDVLAKQGDQPAVVMCCGAKNTGKSTFNRMLVNTALQSLPAVAYLECDIGQSEFSPPATVALHILTQPVMGPPFCHQLPAERMVFYGEVSPGTDPSTYIKCLTYVYEAYSQLETPIPLIVNTMGWVEGVGLMLLIDTVHLTRPDLIIQLESPNQVVNPPAITHERVALDPGWTVNTIAAEDPRQKMEETHKHELMLLLSMVHQRRDFSLKLSSVDVRNLTLISCLSHGLEKGVTLTSLTPYMIPYADLAMHVCHHKVTSSETLVAMNASLVALCVADISQATKKNKSEPYVFEEMPVCDCLGLGIVRAVDTVKGNLYLVTSLPICKLRQVNTILKGSLPIPDQLILKQKTSGPIPYVDALAPSTAVGALRQRSRMPRNTFVK